MAKCDLSIELDDPKSIYAGGGKITGIVHVDVDKNVTTKGLEVSSGWATHGRGNVDSGEFATEILFTGEWRAGEKHEYRFELPVGHWPPSYHGDYLNIDHYIKARAKIPWGFDPKASQAFLMRPSGGPDVALPKAPMQISGMIGCVIAMVFFGGFFTVFFGGLIAAGGPPVIAIVVGVLLLLVGGFVGARYFMPKYLLGNVELTLDPLQVSPGDEVRGELVVRPRKNVNINEIKLTFKACEKVISGSGSNRTTHTNPFFEKATTLHESGVLQVGKEHRIPLSVKLPDDAPYSIDLSDNNIIWSTHVRIDIPRWPDWTRETPVLVVPSGKEVVATPVPSSQVATPVEPAAPSGSGITFAETAQHLWGLKDDREQVEELVDAVTGLSFDIEAFIERRLLYSGEEDPHCYEDGYAIWAHFTDPPLPMVLYVPHDLADEFEQIGRDLWRGQGTIVGWDSQHRRLQVKL